MSKFEVVNFLLSFIKIFQKVAIYAIIGRILLSWFAVGGMRPQGRTVEILHEITDPFLNLAKRIPHSIGMIDLSPLIAILGIDLIGYLLATLIVNLV